MSTLTITTTYDTAQILYEAQIDAIKTPIETYFNTTQIEGSNIQGSILDGATYLADDSISADKLASNSVTTSKLVDSTPSSDTGITTAKINTDAITTAKLDDLAVITAKIDDGDVTTAKIVNNSVPKTIMLANPTASATITDTSVAITSSSSNGIVGSVTITGLTVGKPVIVSLQSSSSTVGYGYININVPADGFSFTQTDCRDYSVKFYKDSSLVNRAPLELQGVNGLLALDLKVPLSMFTYIDIATSTSHTYDVYFGTDSSFVGDDGTMSINSAKLVAIQIV